MYTDSSLTDNIISRHFNQNLTSELFSLNYQLNNDQINQNNQLNKIDQFSQIDQLNQFNQNYQVNQINEINEINQLNQDYQVDDKEIIQNKKDKIRDLIKDCELINNNNINNFVTNYLGNKNQTGLPQAVNDDKCKCNCHDHKKNKNPFHLIRSNKFISTLSRIKSHPKSTVKKTDNHCSINNSTVNLDQDYTFASSLSNYSLSSSSISSQTFSVSSCSSSVQDNNYNLVNTNSVLTRPVRPPPPTPVLPVTTAKIQKPPAKLPPSFSDDFEKINLGKCGDENYSNCEKKCKDENGYNYEDMRILTKSFEDLLNIKTDLSEIQESIYETIDSDYEEDSKDDKICADNNLDKGKDNEEDLYQDIENLKDDDDDDIYESLTNVLHGSLDLLNDIKDLPIKQDHYVNYQKNHPDDRKLLKQQKILDKKLQSQAEKLKKKFNVSGNEIPLNVGVVKRDYKGTHNNLTVNKDEIVLIMRIESNPPGKWLAKNERGKFGYIDLNLVDVDTNTLKCLYNKPNVLMN